MPLVVWVATLTQPMTYSGAHVVPCQRPSIEASLSGWFVGDLDGHVGAEDDDVRDREDDEERQGQR